MFFKSELQRTLDNADALSSSDISMVADYLDKELANLSHQEQFNSDNKTLFKEKLSEAKSNRQNAISSLGEKDPDWVKYALWESYLIALVNNDEKKMLLVGEWVSNNR
mgnify:CR=1 FL=1